MVFIDYKNDFDSTISLTNSGGGTAKTWSYDDNRGNSDTSPPQPDLGIRYSTVTNDSSVFIVDVTIQYSNLGGFNQQFWYLMEEGGAGAKLWEYKETISDTNPHTWRFKFHFRGGEPNGAPTYLETLDKLDQWSTAQYIPDRRNSSNELNLL